MNGTTYKKVYTGNKTELVTFYDLANNVGTGEVKIEWIDKTPITGTVVYTPPSWTNTNVEVEISFNKPLSDVTIYNNGGNVVYEYTDNGTFEYEFKDKYGNTGSLLTEVTWIDRELPECKLKYKPIKGNYENLVTLTECNEPITVLNNG